MSTHTYQPDLSYQPVQLTAAALNYLKKRISKLGHGIGLQLSVKKSGCSGYEYQTAIIDQVDSEKEAIYQIDTNFILTVPKKDLPILHGTQIDYVKKGINYEMVFTNPNQTGACGCGISFTVDDSKT